ncbi:MAG: STAS domain-containing protein [Cyanobacteria bacterium P01_F01_bin.42]
MTSKPYTIKPSGHFNASQSADFRAQIEEAIASEASMVLFDCQEVLGIDSSGLGELILAFKSLRAAGARFILCSINEQIETLLSLTDMTQVFEVYKDRSFLADV